MEVFRLQSILNVIRCIYQRFSFKNSGISCLALIFNPSNQRTTILQAKNGFQVARYYDSSFLPIRTHNFTDRGRKEMDREMERKRKKREGKVEEGRGRERERESWRK